MSKSCLPLVALASLLSFLALFACSRSNNLLLGRVQGVLDNHQVVVTDCYRTAFPPPRRTVEAGVTIWEFAPCRDAVVMIRGDKLTVNGRSYGHLDANDSILVDHGAVSIQHGGETERARN